MTKNFNLNNNCVKIFLLIASIVIVAVLGSVFVNLGMDWFSNLSKPTQWIPNILIPIVWSVIYGVFGIVLSIWLYKFKMPRSTVILLVINGILNILWCLVFFTLKQTFLGNILIIFNLIAGILLLVNIYKNSKIFAYITLIYPVWLSIATSLNIALWILD